MVFRGCVTGLDARRLLLKAAPTHVETNACVLKELFGLWESRASFYGDFLFRFSSNEDNRRNMEECLYLFPAVAQG
jgi:hypothetical protein